MQQDTIPATKPGFQFYLKLKPHPDVITKASESIVFQDSAKLKAYSEFISKSRRSKDSAQSRTTIASMQAGQFITDTTSVCSRNSILDVTFSDSTQIVYLPEVASSDKFPFIFTEKNRLKTEEARASLIKHLKPGQKIPDQPLHDDWIIGIIMVAAFIYSLIGATSKSVLPGVARFFMLRGVTDTSSARDGGGLFHWQATIINFVSFLIIGLFAYSAGVYYNFIPSGINDILFWVISLGIIIIAITLRHILCIITGNASGEKEVFHEYLLGIYQSYRFSAMFLFIIIILMVYTVFFPANFCFIAGIIVIAAMYLIRIIRLMIIFLKRNISIFYLILYLCALEILPVLISVKYFTGLV
jgi:hypothetical protein